MKKVTIGIFLAIASIFLGFFFLQSDFSGQETKNADSEISVTKVADWTETQRLNTSCVTSYQTGDISCFGGRGNERVSKRLTTFDTGTFEPGYYSEIIPYAYASACAPDSEKGIIYCFGGYKFDRDNAVPHNNLWQMYVTNFGTNEMELDIEKLDFVATGMSCVESVANKMIYCFGGFLSDYYGRDFESHNEFKILKNELGQEFSGSVVGFNLETKEIEIIEGDLQIAGDDMSCVYHEDTQKVYCFGGDMGAFVGSETDRIFSFDPDSNEIEILETTLPEPLSVTSCVSHPNSLIYCFGGAAVAGAGVSNESSDIFVFNPSKEQLSVITSGLPDTLAGHSCALDPQNTEDIYCFGGSIATLPGVYKITP